MWVGEPGETGVTAPDGGRAAGAAAASGGRGTGPGHGCPGAARRQDSARDGVTEGGKGRSDGPLPSQAQHAADHTRPKSMWPRETKRCWAVMRPIEQDDTRPVKPRPDTGPAAPPG
ncbi:hypothetical protein GCM10018772_28070 [Streptomyces fumanus]|uniref:Uncharacterized protein n=1 Tax=Streptomyces fumanus TaxID=67302 RepID=A0A919ADK6_9ACTN|nr:hypothetical protein GCM10018772_28070 [Streptomyces fumanus]